MSTIRNSDVSGFRIPTVLYILDHKQAFLVWFSDHHLNNGSFDNLTQIYLLNTRLVQYSDGYCTFFLFQRDQIENQFFENWTIKWNQILYMLNDINGIIILLWVILGVQSNFNIFVVFSGIN